MPVQLGVETAHAFGKVREVHFAQHPPQLFLAGTGTARIAQLIPQRAESHIRPLWQEHHLPRGGMCDAAAACTPDAGDRAKERCFAGAALTGDQQPFVAGNIKRDIGYDSDCPIGRHQGEIVHGYPTVLRADDSSGVSGGGRRRFASLPQGRETIYDAGVGGE